MTKPRKLIKCNDCQGTGVIDNPATIGSVLRAERIKAGVSQKAIAARMGLKQSTISDYEGTTRKDCGFSPVQVREYRASLKKEARK